MKAFKLTLITLCGILAGLAAVSCGTRGSGKTSSSEVEAAATQDTDCFSAIDKYLTEVIGPQYSPGEVCIPYCAYSDVEEGDGGDIRVWGDFWVENFTVEGDTLVFVSGGNHPGRMHLKRDGEGKLSVEGFDAVGDGSEFLPTAKSIFGTRFDDFMKAYSDHSAREEVRKGAITAYVSAHGLPVKVYKDYGWPAVAIPVAGGRQAE